MPAAEKERLVRAFATAIGKLTDYIPGPDMGTDEFCAAWIYDEIGRAASLPAALGGIPVDELGATGYGLAVAIHAARTFIGLELEGARVVVQGFGAVGKHAARVLVEQGAVLVGASDPRGAITNPRGLDVPRVDGAEGAGGGAWADLPGGQRMDRDAVIEGRMRYLDPGGPARRAPHG